jgi:hypothetical protein
MRIHTLTIDNGQVAAPSRDGGIDASRTDILNDNGTADAISSPTDEADVDIKFAGAHAGRRAVALDELCNSVAVAPVAVNYAPDASFRGYYIAESTSRQLQLATDDDDQQTLGLSLTEVGTRASHRRAVFTRPTQPDPGNVFGNDLTALVGVPTAADRVKWHDRSFTASEDPTAVETVTTAGGDVVLYDARAPAIADDPVLTYRPSEPEAQTDLAVWDTYGDVEFDAGGDRRWARVFDTSHDPLGEFVIDNGRIRLFLADAPAAIGAETWDATASEWSPISLPASDWQLVETDLVRIGAAAVDAQCVFSDGTDDYALDLRLERGRKAPQWLIPESVTDPIPTGLEDLLDPIADGSIYHTGASLDLVDRQKLRK